MSDKIIEIEDDELLEIGGSKYVRIPKSIEKSIGITNFDGSKTSKKIKRAKVQNKHGFCMSIWGEYQNK